MFIGSCAGNFYAINKTTGQAQWSYDIRKDGKQVSFHGDPLVTGDLILIGTDYSCAPGGVGHVYAFAREWKSALEVPLDQRPYRHRSTQFKCVLRQFSGQVVFRRSSHRRLKLEFFYWHT